MVLAKITATGTHSQYIPAMSDDRKSPHRYPGTAPSPQSARPRRVRTTSVGRWEFLIHKITTLLGSAFVFALSGAGLLSIVTGAFTPDREDTYVLVVVGAIIGMIASTIAFVTGLTERNRQIQTIEPPKQTIAEVIVYFRCRCCRQRQRTEMRSALTVAGGRRYSTCTNCTRHYSDCWRTLSGA